MKKLAAIVSISILFVLSANAQGLVSSEQPLSTNNNKEATLYSAPTSGYLADRPVGTIAANLGVGVGAWGFSLAVDGEYTFANFGSGMSMSGGIYGTVCFSSFTRIFAGPEAVFHWAVLDNLDVFTKLILGYHHYYYSLMGSIVGDGGFRAGAYVGATYFLNKSIGIGGVVGYGGPNLAAQVTYRF